MAGDKKDVVASWEKLGVFPVSISQVPKILDISWAMEPKLTVCLVGDTGIGKTPIVQQWARKQGGEAFMLNFGHMTQEEISMIFFNEDGTEFDFVPPGFLNRINEQAEEEGCAVLFLDEWNRGDKALVNALFTLTDERRIHSFRLHDNVLVVAAMNPSDGSYLVNEAEKDHAIRKRLNFIYVTHDLPAFLKHTKEANWHPLVPAYIKAAPEMLYDMGARDAGKCFPCPSNWEKTSTILNGAHRAGLDLDDPNQFSAVEAMVVGQIGKIAATRFMDFVRDQNVLIQPSEVLESYKPNSKVRKRVQACLSGKNQRHDVISNLSKGIAIELFSSQPNPSDIAECLANYIADLPPDLLSAFAAQDLFQQSEEHGGNSQDYLSNISSAMTRFPPYKSKMKEIVQAINEYKNQAGLTKGRDPMR